MNSLFFIWLFLNTLATGYLIFLVYRRNLLSSKNSQNQAIPTGTKIKMQLTRFNPFDDLGGDQSFILCLLDNTNTGAIITSLHSRDVTRIYAKPIKNGNVDGTVLSKDETRTLIKTINS
ncbi:DUF4446 family protein [Candidatus Shapirobacteria bacterium]|nr:DUF4446 family protein [Candidatus Shapirobacteria bacterium]